LIEGPWKGTTVSDASLARVIMMARKTLTDRGRLGHLIQTVRGKGYRFLAEVTSSSTAGSSTTRTDSSSSTTSRSAADPIGNRTFLGRKQELEIMLAAAERAAGGHGNLLLVGGEPGIGKTSLLERFGRTVLGMEILWGRCWEGGGAPAFWPWLEIVRQYVDRHGDELILSMGSAASDIARWLPELRPKLPDFSLGIADQESPQARFRTFDSVTRLLARVARTQPLAVIIDDLHAADDSSVMLLDFMARTLDSTCLLLIASFRDLEVRDRPVLSTFLGGPHAHVAPMTLSGLTEPEVATLLSSSVGQPPSPEIVRRIFKATNGNPFLVREVGRTTSPKAKDSRFNSSRLESFRVPKRVADIVRRHLRHLPGSTVTTLSTASVIGREFDLPLLRELCGSDPARGVGDLEPALLEGIVRESLAATGVFSFSHALIRETLYHELPPTRRLSLHFSAAELLERQQVSDYAAAFQFAHHYFSAAAHKGADKALEWALKAGQRARDIYAYEQAAEHYGRALQALDLVGRDEAKACEILLLLADAQRLSGHTTESIATFQQVESIGRSRELSVTMARALLGYVEVLRDAAGADETLHDRIEEALEKLPDGDSRLRARLLGALSFVGILTRPIDALLPLSESAIAMARRLGDPETLAVVLYWCHWTMSRGSQPKRALDLATELIQIARDARNTERLLDARLWRAGHLYASGRGKEADVEIVEHARVANEFRHPVHLWWARLASSSRALLAGEIERAETLANEALALGRPLQEFTAEGLFGAQMVAIGVEKEGDEKHRTLDQAAAIGRKMQQLVPSFRPWGVALALVQLEIGLVVEAQTSFNLLAKDEFRDVPDDHNRVSILVMFSRLACGLRDATHARPLYRHLKPHAGTHVMLSLVAAYWGPVAHYLGTLAVLMDEPDLAQSHFHAAITESALVGSPSWEAWAEYELGLLLSRKKRPADSERGVALIRGALATARRLGLARLERKARTAVRERR